MSRNTYLVIGLVILLIIIGFVLLNQRAGNEVIAPTGKEVSTPQESVPTQPAAPPPSAGQSVASPAAKSEVIYTDSGFSPNNLTIKAGETVIFKNNSSRDFWPASAVHPTHAIYPEKGGCIGSKFDACKAISPGGSWSFTFNRVGSWKYHDHLNASFTGTITVQ